MVVVWVVVNVLCILFLDELIGNFDLNIVNYVFDVLVVFVCVFGVVILFVIYNLELVGCMDWVIILLDGLVKDF